jgi:hypothetical protein
MNNTDADLLIQRHFEESLSAYEEQRLSKLILLGGAFSDRFVEWRELERGLAEHFGGRKKSARAALISAGSCAEGYADRCRARRYPSASREALPDGCAGEIFSAYDRWLRSVGPGDHRDALAHCLGLIVEDLQELLAVRYRSGMTSRDIADLLGRPAAETEDLFCRIKRFLAGCVRMRLSRTA